MHAIFYTNDEKEIEEILDLVNACDDATLLQRTSRVYNKNGATGTAYELHVDINLKN